MRHALLFPLLVLGPILGSCTLEDLLLETGESEPYEFDFADLEEELDVAPGTFDPSQFELFSLESNDRGDRATIWAFYLGDQDRIGTDPVIIFCHGNGSTLTDAFFEAGRLALAGGETPFGVMAIDYRGFGNSAGRTSHRGYIADLNAAVSWLEMRGMTEDRLAIYGQSLGGTPATLGATHPAGLAADKLILEVPFPGATATFQGATGLSIPGTAVSELSSPDPVESMSRHEGDLLWMHPEDDPVVPIELGRVLYDAHHGRSKVALNPPEGGHSAVEGLGDEEFAEAVRMFIEGG